MYMAQISLHYLIEQYASGKITDEELDLFKKLITSDDGENRTLAVDEIRKWLEGRPENPLSYEHKKWDKILRDIIKIDKEATTVKTVPFRHLPGVYRTVTRYAAAILLLIGLSVAMFVYLKRSPDHSEERVSRALSVGDILPGSDRAVLILGDGSQITLDSLAPGVIAAQGSTSVIKPDNGEIVYTAQSGSAKDVLWNTMSVPRGGQYRLTLPDGTKVWLNAASSITYPTIFAGHERLVKVKGEVYMEVAHDKTMPFIVNVDDKINVKALGTSFNINSYPDEENIITTLVEGKVQVWEKHETGKQEPEREKKMIILSPGQQVLKVISRENAPLQQISVNPDQVSQVLAWKNGYFSFENTGIKEMARQIERWYDVKFIFEGDFSDMELGGKMDRGVKLSDIIRFFNDYGFKTELTGRVVTVRK